MPGEATLPICTRPPGAIRAPSNDLHIATDERERLTGIDHKRGPLDRDRGGSATKKSECLRGCRREQAEFPGHGRGRKDGAVCEPDVVGGAHAEGPADVEAGPGSEHARRSG